MLPVIALVGRPNVGKSTIFNCLTRSRDAIVADIPGVTRDRQHGHGKLGDKPFLVVDTGGVGEIEHVVDQTMLDQTCAAIAEADYLFFIVDAQVGLTAADQDIAKVLRQSEKPVRVVINKTEGIDVETECTEFFKLGFEEFSHIAAAHNRGMRELISTALMDIPEQEPEAPSSQDAIKVAIVGRPNVGKSTLINRILGEERVVVFDLPGTTRDSIDVPFSKDEQDYILIDTAGVRRRSRVSDVLEKFSIIKTLQSIQEANVVLILFNAKEGIGEQDLRMLGHVLDAGKSFMIIINQWDGLSANERDQIKSELDRRLTFVAYAKQYFISALHGTGVGLLLGEVKKIYKSATQELSTSYLTKLLETAVERFPPPLSRGRRIKLRFAHPAGLNPPTIKIHGTQTTRLRESYQRYLMNYFRESLKLIGTPVVLQFADSENPFKEQRNKPTERQIKKKRRLLKHVKKNKKK